MLLRSAKSSRQRYASIDSTRTPPTAFAAAFTAASAEASATATAMAAAVPSGLVPFRSSLWTTVATTCGGGEKRCLRGQTRQ